MLPVIVPDLHGEIELLEQVLAQFPDREFVFLGDLVDRGPNTPAVVQRVIELALDKRATVLLGNHEDMMIRGVKYGHSDFFRCWVGNGGTEAIAQYELAGPELLKEHIDWLDAHCFNWLEINTPHGKVLCSHASRPKFEYIEAGFEAERKLSYYYEDFIWKGQNDPTISDYAFSVHGHVPQMKRGKPVWHTATNGEKYLMLDIGSCFNGKLAVLDLQDLKTYSFTRN